MARLHEILKLTEDGWDHVQYFKCKTITQAEKQLYIQQGKHPTATGWKIVPYKQVEHNVRVYQPTLF